MTAEAGTTSDGKRPVVMLVDGFGLIFRAFYAIQNGLTTSSGQQVAAVFGFATMLLETLRVHRPDHAVVALEGGKTFRHDTYEQYKANRPEMPPEFQEQVDVIRTLLEALNIPVMIRDGFEADDVIGSLSTHLSHEDRADVLIVTGDSDLLQLVDDHVTVVLPGRTSFSDLRTFDREAVIERYGIGPELVPDYKAIVGDTSDNVAGVKGIGDKGAKALLQQWGPIEAIIAHLPEVTPERARKAMEAGQQDAIESKKIVTIVRDLDVALDWDHSAVGNYDRGRVFDLFRELEFRTLLNKLPEVQEKAEPVAARTFEPVRTIVRTGEQLDALVARIAETGRLALDVETTSTDPMLAALVGIAIAVDAEESYYIPLTHRTLEDGPQLELDVVRERLIPAVGGATQIVAHHGKYDLQVMSRHGFPIVPLAFDTMIAAYLLGESSIRLKDLAFTRLGIQMTEITELIGTGRKQLTMDMVAGDEAGSYACGDVEATLALADVLAPEIRERELDRLLFDEEQPLVPVLIAMERTGIAVDTDYLGDFSTELTERLDSLETAIQDAAGRPINIGSNKQLADLLFVELGLAAGRRTKTGYSVDADELERLRGSHPIVGLILEHRSLSKLKSTYVDSLAQSVHPETGRVHTSFNQTIAATGRLSSTNPNLQNIPIRSEEGRRVRHAFVADTRSSHRLFDDPVLLSADYSQIELRLLAHMSGEPFLVEAFRNGDDIHRATAAIVYGVGQDDVSANQRRVAKTVNFGVMYGMQAFGLARDSGLSNADAGRFIEQYWARLPRVRELFDRTVNEGVKNGYVAAPSGRRRYLPDLTSSNGMRRISAERMAVNMPVQGTAADIIKVAMIRLHDALIGSPLRARLLLQVHDELVLEVAREDLEATAELVLRTMEGAAELSVPLLAEVNCGPRWDEMEPIFRPAASAAD
jgi:DNA polymerase-1